MVSSYSSNLRITKQATGDNPNTWGSITNEQVIELLEDAISGVVDVDVTGTADVTLTTNDGSTDQARNSVLELTGTVGADLDLLIPSVEKVYMVRGGWTGDYTVTVKIAGSSTSIPITTGDVKLIYSNGTDTYSNEQDVSSLLVASNNLSDLTDTAAAIVNLGIVDPDPHLVGEVKLWPAATIPSNWSTCIGGTVSRTTYASLFSLIGTLYGPGDGSSTFNLPDYRGRGPIALGVGDTAEGGGAGTERFLGNEGGTETHTLTEAQMPSHDHVVFSAINDTAAGSNGRNTYEVRSVSGNTNGLTDSAGGDEAHPIMQPFFATNFIIYLGVPV